MRITRQRFGRPSIIVKNVFEAVKDNSRQLRDDSKALPEILDYLMTNKNTLISMNCMSDPNSSSVLETVVRRLLNRPQRKWVEISSRTEDGGIEPIDILKLVEDSASQAVSKFASILHTTPGIENPESELQSLMTKGPQRSGYQENCMVSSNPYKLIECDSFRGTSPTDSLQVERQTLLCITRLQEVRTKANCGKLNVKSASSSSDSTSLQGITSQSKVIRPLRIYEEELESSFAVI
ncbi:unnamed protein product [Trichobilharzia regenti]|nr:unnamed protein product [Trichobilharzia regenti]